VIKSVAVFEDFEWFFERRFRNPKFVIKRKPHGQDIWSSVTGIATKMCARGAMRQYPISGSGICLPISDVQSEICD
jgi:hypothetical protein